MKKLCFLLFAILFLYSKIGVAQELSFKTKDGEMIIPNASIEKPDDKNIRLHSEIIIYKTNKKLANGLPPNAETPASIACIYGLTVPIPGCPIHGTTAVPTGGWGAIAVVEQGDDPFAEEDLNVFSRQFGLPPCTTANGCFRKVFVGGVVPPVNPSAEHDLDAQWAHAMAPNAKIIMVEGRTFEIPEVFRAIDLASQLVQAAGGGEVSISDSHPEFAGEAAYDSHFTTPGIVYFGSAGDYSAPARYPSSSPNVISAGGTQIVRDGNGNFVKEIAWSRDFTIPPPNKNGGSGGPSVFEPRPAYQNIVAKIVGGARGTPDISFDSAPISGVAVYSTLRGGWVRSGGTSVAAPALAGIINAANSRAMSTSDELMIIYTGSIKNYHSYWNDTLEGFNGFQTLAGYDFVTGLGSPRGYGGK